ncbi:phosphate ABC transporter substrate-binding protein PstS family protein [Nibribacter ruber]|uniref:Phosphate-binding protein n=1 Tax=Nibribacter ruber TaxID=2698458 RepID=A0A6P1NPV2_9BACT|nr:phosphate ABC transporter substrate-binding protein [Nibribacter ruber]QHL85936.1 phosphate ABC transporter substrate-binding protein PstS family protein [Nibribacter ruber]
MKTTFQSFGTQAASLFLAATLLVSCGKGGDQKAENVEADKTSGNATTTTAITIKGSDTVLPLAQQEAERYMAQHKDASITIVGGGTGVGVSALMEGTTDIAMASRELKTKEKLELKGAKKDIQEALIAYDALSVIVNPKNKVSQLTREQLEGIFTGKITNWKEVGGADAKVVAYSRETSSGTYEFFKEHVLDKKNYANNILMMPATGSIVQSVGQTEGAIGYIGLAYESPEVKSLAVSYDQGKTYVKPSVAAAQDKSYPVSRPLFFFYDASSESKVKPFIDYILSPEGQKTVLEIGYVPLNK